MDFFKVFDDKLEIWNPGILPEQLTVEQLKSEHSSYPRNKHIAGVFFRAGYIESWGRGTNKIIETCVAVGLPEPIIEEDQGGLRITFLKNIYTEEYLSNLNLPKRQVQTLLFIKQKGSITNAQYQELAGVSQRTASRDLQELIDLGYIKKIGTTGRGTSYILLLNAP